MFNPLSKVRGEKQLSTGFSVLLETWEIQRAMEGDCVTDAMQEAEEEKVHSATQSFCEALRTSPKHLDWFLRLTSSLILIFTLHQGLKSWTPNLRVPLNIASQMASFFFSFVFPYTYHFPFPNLFIQTVCNIIWILERPQDFPSSSWKSSSLLLLFWFTDL